MRLRLFAVRRTRAIQIVLSGKTVVAWLLVKMLKDALRNYEP